MITDELVEEMWITFDGYDGGSRPSMRAAAEVMERRVLARAQKPMHEPVSAAEAEAMQRAFSGTFRTKDGPMRAAGNALLAGRAAATRAKVVVTEAMIRECETDWLAHGRREMPMDYCRFSLQWLAARLNGEHEKLVDPRVALVQTRLKMTREVAEDFLALLDEVKT